MKEISKNYATSTDYERLKELMDKGVIVVCLIEGLPHADGNTYQRVCVAKKHSNAYLVSRED